MHNDLLAKTNRQKDFYIRRLCTNKLKLNLKISNKKDHFGLLLSISIELCFMFIHLIIREFEHFIKSFRTIS